MATRQTAWDAPDLAPPLPDAPLLRVTIEVPSLDGFLRTARRVRQEVLFLYALGAAVLDWLVGR